MNAYVIQLALNDSARFHTTSALLPSGHCGDQPHRFFACHCAVRRGADVHHELAAADHDGHEHSDTDLCQWVKHHTAGFLDVGAPLFTAQELIDLLEVPADSVLLSSELSMPGPSRAPPCN